MAAANLGVTLRGNRGQTGRRCSTPVGCTHMNHNIMSVRNNNTFNVVHETQGHSGDLAAPHVSAAFVYINALSFKGCEVAG